MPLRLSALFFRILRYFFHSFVAAKQKKEMLPLMILSNHFETAPFVGFYIALKILSEVVWGNWVISVLSPV